jgi:hypothetical protein
MSTPQARGDALEKKVANLLRSQGKARVRTNVLLRDAHGNLSEIDVVYGRWPFKHYIECKAYRKRSVPLEDVAKFKEVLTLHNVSLSRGMLVTTSTFTPRCKHVGVRLMNGEQLQQWEKRIHRQLWVRRTFLGVAVSAVIATAFTYPNETADLLHNRWRVCQTTINSWLQ